MEEPKKKGAKPVEHKKEQERCILVGIATPKIRPWLAGEQLAELGRLAETAGAYVTRSFLQRVQNFSPATLIGEGKVNEVKRALEEDNAKMVVFDDDLSGSQVRNLEERMPGIKVLDRTGLILDIFAKHAVTAESRLMVEVAQLQYMMPRLTGAWTHLCRQHNGGIGTKGPGETQLETDRRMIRKRIQELKKKLEKIEDAREQQADKRNDISILRSMGADDSDIRRIFFIEGLGISFVGAVIGLFVGGLICWLQMTYGFVKLGDGSGSFIIDAYPVAIHLIDVLWSFVAVMISSPIARRARNVRTVDSNTS